MSSREGTQRSKMDARQESNYCSTIDDLECFNYIDFGDAGGELGWVRSCGICSSMSKFDHVSKQRLLRQYAQLSTLRPELGQGVLVNGDPVIKWRWLVSL